MLADVVQSLSDEHVAVEGRLRMLEDAMEEPADGDLAWRDAELRSGVDYLARNLLPHLDREETEVFPEAVREPALSPLVAELQTHHEDLRRLLADAERAVDQEGPAAAMAPLGKLVELLREHIASEETALFPVLT
ncbi:Hemerythrin domain-containing protein [Candidatus Hydrogenisulfobacillus filiaventi]|uniref:Hemerythrin domain-containing protein n=1 Tax=Candidatus Hydrogenisulfobacillus filiaventi TaxID=2707344 RepID=A0A6F8ZDB9_9FIRM|nr:hemerythrin domain-containing protein [Bacillota bacterium]CAB1127684.1 Hemerythrin domain-containing protein [Candidatus Hydrogenisulfobacillus filiaventi]